MDGLQLPILCFLVAVFTLMLFRRYGPKKGNDNRLPSPSKLPIIGSFHHLLGGLPHHQLRKLAQQLGPLMLLRLGMDDYLVVSSHDAAEEVLKAHDINFSSRPAISTLKTQTYNYTNIVFTPYGDYWRQMRKISTMEVFTAHRVRSFAQVRDEEISKLVDEIAANDETPINLTFMVRLVSNAIIFTVAMGRNRHRERYLGKAAEVAKILEGKSIIDLFSPFKLFQIIRMKTVLEGHHYTMDAILDQIIKERYAEKIDNPEFIIEVMLSLKDSGELQVPITLENIKAVYTGLFGAGTETSAATVDWALSELLTHPEMLERAQKEVREALEGKTKVGERDIEGLKFLKLVVKETLRLHPPVPVVPRACREGCYVQGHYVPSGRRVLVNLWALGRDPEYWEDADSFKPERFDGSSLDYLGRNVDYLPFGAGRRICPGTTFGLMFVELVLANLLFHFDWKLPGGKKGEELDMTENLWAACVRKSPLRLIPKTRIPPSTA